MMRKGPFLNLHEVSNWVGKPKRISDEGSLVRQKETTCRIWCDSPDAQASVVGVLSYLF